MNQTNLYAQLEALPANMTGEIIDGQLIAQPRPAWPHCYTGSVLGADILPPYQKGRGGPGGWWIIDAPEIHFLRDVDVAVPDIAGWRRKRMPRPPRSHSCEVVPDWICEIASPSTEAIDRTKKMPLYARYGVQYLWLVKPLLKTLEIYQLNNGKWLNIDNYKDDDKVSAVPFQEIVIQLQDLWIVDEE